MSEPMMTFAESIDAQLKIARKREEDLKERFDEVADECNLMQARYGAAAQVRSALEILASAFPLPASEQEGPEAVSERVFGLDDLAPPSEGFVDGKPPRGTHADVVIEKPAGYISINGWLVVEGDDLDSCVRWRPVGGAPVEAAPAPTAGWPVASEEPTTEELAAELAEFDAPPMTFVEPIRMPAGKPVEGETVGYFETGRTIKLPPAELFEGELTGLRPEDRDDIDRMREQGDAFAWAPVTHRPAPIPDETAGLDPEEVAQRDRPFASSPEDAGPEPQSLGASSTLRAAE